MTDIHIPEVATGKRDHLIVHCTATPPSVDADADWVDRVHRQRGWSGCGYHAIIRRSGELQHEPTGHRTRPYHRTGAHVGGCGPGWNGRSIGVSLEGGVSEDGRPENNFTEEQMQTLSDYIDEVCFVFMIPIGNVMGHRDLIKATNAAPKACPCFSVRDWLAMYMFDDERTEFGDAKQTRGKDPLKVNRTYTVRSGDTLGEISDTFGVPLRTIERLNNIDRRDYIVVGQKLRLRN